MKARISTALVGRVEVCSEGSLALTALDDRRDDVPGVAVALVQTVVQRCVGSDVLRQQHREGSDQLRGTFEALRDPAELGDQIARPVRVRVVVGVAGVQHRVEQLLLGLEVVQQPGGRHPGLFGDLRQRGGAPAVARQQTLGHGEDALSAVLTFGEQGRVGTRRGFGGCHSTPCSTNLVNTQ